MTQSIYQNEEIGAPVYNGFTFGGYALTTPLLKADYPGLRAIRLEDGTVILAEDLPDSYTIPPGGGGGGGDHVDSDHADAFSPLAHTHAAHADSDHDDRFSLLAHTHAAHADSDHDDRFALIEHDSAHSDVYSALAHTHAVHADSDHDDRFSLLAHTHAAHADSDHDDRFSLLAHAHAGVYAPVEHDTTHDDRFALIAQGVPAGGALGQVLAKASATNYDTLWQSASAPAPQALDWLTDVATAGQASTNVLTYNGSSWVPAAVPASGHSHATSEMVKARAQDNTGATISTTEGIRLTATLTIPAGWAGYDIEALLTTDVLESGTLTAIRTITIRLRLGTVTGTILGNTAVNIDSAPTAAQRMQAPCNGYITGQTATGSVAVVFTTQIGSDTGQASYDNATLIATAYRTS